MTGADFAALLTREGFDLFAGVPCSLVGDLIAALERRSPLPWIEAVREDAAVGLAGGAWLAGRRPVQPHFLPVKVTPAAAEMLRIPHSPPAIRDRFRAALGAS